MADDDEMDELQLLKIQYQKLQTDLTILEQKYQSLLTTQNNFNGDGTDNFATRLQLVVADLFNNQLYSDIMILLEGGDMIYGHKLVLSARLKEWYGTDMQQISLLDLSDIRYEVACTMMEWLYKDELNIVEEDFLIELLQATVKYKLDSLHLRCQRALIPSINCNNCDRYLEIAKETSAQLLQSRCIVFSSELKNEIFEPRKTSYTEEVLLTFYTCSFCEETFQHNNDLEQHNKCHIKEDCETCDIKDSTPSERNLRKSETSVFKTLKKKTTNQQSTSTNKPSKKSERKIYKCDDCGKIFRQSSHLKQHTVVHTGLKPFQCDQCGRSFTQSSGLQGHIRIHTGEKPYKCDVCGKTFRSLSSLQQHNLVHTGLKAYQCDLCGKALRSSSHLNTHLRTHTGEKPYKCDVCSSAFSSKCHMLRHMRIHTGEKPYKCHICEQHFRASGNLQRHIKTHKCDITLSGK